MQNTALFLALLFFALLAVWVVATHDYDPPDDSKQRLEDWMNDRRRD